MAFRSTFAPNFDCLVRLGNQGIAVGANTLAAWVRFDNLSATYEVLEINDSGGAPFASAILLSGNQIEYIQRNAAGAGLGLLSVTTVAINTWYHVALTWDGTTLRGYLNGVEEVNGTGLAGARGNWADLQFGPTLGYLSDGVFYTAALTPEQIVQLYRRRLPGRRDNIFAHLPTFAGAANRRLDYSGLGHHFTDNATPTDSTVAPPQAGWGTSHPRALYSDATGTPLPIAAGGATLFAGDAAALKNLLAASGGNTLFGGAADAQKAEFIAAGGSMLFGGNAAATTSKNVAADGATLFGGAAAAIVVKYAQAGGSTLFGGDAAATGGGGPPPSVSDHTKMYRRGPRYSR